MLQVSDKIAGGTIPGPGDYAATEFNEAVKRDLLSSVLLTSQVPDGANFLQLCESIARLGITSHLYTQTAFAANSYTLASGGYTGSIDPGTSPSAPQTYSGITSFTGSEMILFKPDDTSTAGTNITISIPTASITNVPVFAPSYATGGTFRQMDKAGDFREDEYLLLRYDLSVGQFEVVSIISNDVMRLTKSGYNQTGFTTPNIELTAVAVPVTELYDGMTITFLPTQSLSTEPVGGYFIDLVGTGLAPKRLTLPNGAPVSANIIISGEPMQMIYSLSTDTWVLSKESKTTLDASHNFLIGWDFRKNPRQLGEFNTADSLTSFVTNEDNNLIMDQTWLLSDGNDVVDISKGDQDACRMTVVTAGRKFGIFQKITSEDSQSIIYRAKCSLMAAMSATSTSSNLKIAVIGCTGTADQQGIDIIQTWNGENIPPTLNPDFTYLQDPTTATFAVQTGAVSGTGIFPELFFENLSVIAAGTQNIGVFIWSDTLNLLAGDEVQVLYAQLSVGEKSGPIQELSEADTLALCQQFIFKTYAGSDTPLSAFPNTNSPSFEDSVWSFDQSGVSGPFDLFLKTITYTYTFPVPLFKDSTVRSAVVYNPFTSAVNSVVTTGSYVAGAGSVAFTETLSVTIEHISEQYVSFKKSPAIITTGNGFGIEDSDSPCYYQMIVYSTVS